MLITMPTAMGLTALPAEAPQNLHGSSFDVIRCRECRASSTPSPLQSGEESVPVAVLQGVQGISDIITIPGLVNVDFADVKAVMCNSGTAMLGVGVSSGKNRAEEAAAVRKCAACLL